MIKQFEKGIHCPADARMVVEPSSCRVNLTFHRDLHSETVPVHPPALVLRRNIRECLGGFEGKVFGQANLHQELSIQHPIHEQK